MKYVSISVMLSLGLMLSACSDSQETAQTSSTAETTQEAAQPEKTTVQQNEPQQNVSDSEGQSIEAEDASEVSSEEVSEQPEPQADADVDATEQSSSEPVAATDAPKLDANAGQALYESHCKQCHQGGLLGAPKYGDKAEWSARIAKGKETLYLHSAKGFNKMPAQAVGDVSAEQVHAAVDYMVAGSS